ncbi:MAG: transaldolase family protein [Planctomycetota bacterium]
MEFFVDTADLDQIRESYSWGIVDGVTTNPSLIKKAVDKLKADGSSMGIEEYINEILRAAGSDPVSLEVIAADPEAMYTQGMFLYEKFNPVTGNVVVKIPVCPNMGGGEDSFGGLKVIKKLSEQGIPINTTLVFTPEQALLAAKAGASYVSPFAGRIDDELRKKTGREGDGKTAYYPEEGIDDTSDNGILSGTHLIEECVGILAIQGFDGCKVLAASLRNSRQVRECALVGSQVATAPFDVLKQMIEHYKSAEGMRAFTADIVPEYEALFE